MLLTSGKSRKAMNDLPEIPIHFKSSQTLFQSGVERHADIDTTARQEEFFMLSQIFRNRRHSTRHRTP